MCMDMDMDMDGLVILHSSSWRMVAPVHCIASV